MSLEEKALRLAGQLQALLEGAEAADRKDPELSGKLSQQELRALRAVGSRECPIMSALAAAVRLSLSSVTSLVDRLCEKKLVRRDRSSEDRRTVQVALTVQGQALHEAALNARVGFARELLRGLGAGEQDALLSLLGKVSDRLKEKRN